MPSNSNSAGSDDVQLRSIPIGNILADPNNPRKTFDNPALNELAESLKIQGLIQPVVVRPAEKEGIYMLISGERRYRAAVQNGENEILCIVRGASDFDVAEFQLMENICRVDLQPLEKAAALERYATQFNISKVEVARRLALTPTWIRTLEQLSRLTPLAQELYDRGIVKDASSLILLSRLERESPETAKALSTEALENGKLPRASILKARAPFCHRKGRKGADVSKTVANIDPLHASTSQELAEIKTLIPKKEVEALMTKSRARNLEEAVRIAINAFLG